VTARALLAMDFEPAILGRVGGDDCPALPKARAAVEAARAAGVPVIFVRVAFRAGYPEINPRNKGFAAAVAAYGDALLETSPTTAVHPSLQPRDEEAVVVKRRFSAFASDLDALLRGRGITSLTLAGVSTSGVVLSTLRQAADLDYELTVLADACADRDLDLHELLMTKVFPSQATVVTTADWIAFLQG